jgi:hypothetical protein
MQPVKTTTPSTPKYIFRTIKHIPKKEASGHDNVRNIDLKTLPLNAVIHLTKIINAAFRFQ